MKRLLFLATLLVMPVSAQAGFSLKDITGQTVSSTEAPAGAPVKTTSVPRRVKPPMPTAKAPALQVLNERYVPEDIKKKYKMGDDYFEMTNDKAAETPIVVKPAGKPKKTLEIISGPPPVIPSETVAAIPEPIPLASKPALVVEGAPKPLAPPAPAAVAVPKERIETWRARKGELLKDVLKRWANREQTDFIWTAAESPKVSKEFSYVGNFNGAVAGLMNQDSGTLKMKFSDEVMPPVSEEAPEEVTPPAGDMRVPEQDVVAQEPGKTWFATNGASLKAVLRAWAETEGATLIWQADNDFAMPKSFNEKTGFEDAVAKVLTEYETKKVRPVGQLYKNPVSGEKVLVIKADTAG